MKNSFIFALIILCSGLLIHDAVARREIMTARQKERLERADRILVELLTLTDKGQVDPGPVTDVVAERFQELGYTVVTEREEPHDVVFKVKCEQRKVWEGTITSGGDADLPDSPSRVWKGPACQLTYLLRGKNLGWRKEVRTEFQDSIKAAADAGARDPGAFALGKLQEKLERYDFPVLVTADWGQAARLLTLLDAPSTTEERKVKIITELGKMYAVSALPRLVQATTHDNPAIASGATRAIGEIGKPESMPLLQDLLHSERPAVQAAAAQALGQVGALNFDYSVVEPLVEILRTSKDVRVKTAVAWALGKFPDQRAYNQLSQLYTALHTGQDTTTVDPQVAELQKAVAWSLRQIRPADHTYQSE
jgi:hypothetical protein